MKGCLICFAFLLNRRTVIIFAPIMKRIYNLIKAMCPITVLALLASPQDTLAAQEKKSWVPQLFGVIKPRFETNTETGDMRFNINNARLGVKGEAATSPGIFRYQFQADLNAEGKLSILDTYVTFASGAFEITLGQQLSRFCTEISRGPRLNYFASSSFMTSYIGSYYETSSAGSQTGNFGPRDIGIMLKYGATKKFPINIQAGLMNGNGINNPKWSKNVNFVGRVWIDPGKLLNGFGIAANYYTGKTPFGNNITMVGGELRYIKGRWIIEGEYARRWLWLPFETDKLDLAVAHAIYRQPMKNWGPVKFLAPMVRWDYGYNISLLDAQSDIMHFNAQRLTGGLTIGFTEKLLQCELRLNYEHFFIKNKPAGLASNPTFQNKVIVEFFLAF